MGIRSQNNPLAAYLDVFSNTGTDAVSELSIGIWINNEVEVC